jgi:hypothetical protein
MRLLVAPADERVRLQPFSDVELDLGLWWVTGSE